MLANVTVLLTDAPIAIHCKRSHIIVILLHYCQAMLPTLWPTEQDTGLLVTCLTVSGCQD